MKRRTAQNVLTLLMVAFTIASLVMEGHDSDTAVICSMVFCAAVWVTLYLQGKE